MSGKPPQPGPRMPKQAEELMRQSNAFKRAAVEASDETEKKGLMSKANKAYMEGIRSAKEYKYKMKTQGIAHPGTQRRNVELKGGKTQRAGNAHGGDLVSHLLTIRNQIKLYHWQTKQFARHKATDDLTAALDTTIDSFVESYMGRYGRPKVSGSIKLHNFSEQAAKSFVDRETKYLQKELPRKIGKDDTDLLNLRDEILGELTKVSYLFTLA